MEYHYFLFYAGELKTPLVQKLLYSLCIGFLNNKKRKDEKDEGCYHGRGRRHKAEAAYM